MVNTQGELGERAGKELANKDYVRGLTHGVEWLLPGLGPDQAKSGDQLESGDIAGGTGTTLGAAASLFAGTKTPEIGELASSAASKAGAAARVAGQVIKETATPENIGTAIGSATGGAIGHAVGEPIGGAVSGAAIGRAFGKSVASRLTKPAAEVIVPEDVDAFDATGENTDFAGAKPPKRPRWDAHDATGDNRQFAGGMDEWSPAKPKRSLADLNGTPAPAVPTAPAPIAASSPVNPVPAPPPLIARAAPELAASEASDVPRDPLLERLRAIAADIQDKEEAEVETAAKKTPSRSRTKAPIIPGSEEDLTQLLKASLKQVQDRRAAAIQ